MRFTGIALLMTAVAFTAFAAPEKSTVNKTQKSSTVKKNSSKNNNKKKRTPPPANVNISQYAPNGGNVTEAMRKAIKSRTPLIIFDKPGVYQLEPVALFRPVQIILNDGVTIKALVPAPAPKEKKAAALPGLFTGDRVKQIIFKGKGNAVIIGNELPVFAFASSNNIAISNLTVTGGKTAIEAQNCWNFRIHDVVFDNNSGTAVNIYGGNWNGLLNTQFRNIKSLALNIVADQNGKIPNLTIDNCEFFNNSQSVKVAAPAKFTIKPVDLKKNPKYRPPRLTFRSCRFFNNTDLDLEVYGALADGMVRIENSVFTNPANPALKFADFTAGSGLNAEVVNTIFRPAQTNTNTPVTVASVQDKPFGNIKFTKTTVAQPVNKKAITYKLKKSSGNIAGTLKVIAADGSVKNATLVMEDK